MSRITDDNNDQKSKTLRALEMAKAGEARMFAKHKMCKVYDTKINNGYRIMTVKKAKALKLVYLEVN